MDTSLDAADAFDASTPDAFDAAVDWMCDPTAPFGTPIPYAPLADVEAAEPWISGDGLTLVFTTSVPDFRLELRIATRASRSDDFVASSTVTFPSWDGNPSQSSLSGDGNTLYFMAAAQIMEATRDGMGFFDPVVLDVAFPEMTSFPEFPRSAGTRIYYSMRELNRRRSIYVHDSAVTAPVLYDAGDIFTFAISPNERFIYVTFQLDTLEIYRASRSGAPLPFSDFEPIPVLTLERSGLAVTGVTDDDCEVFGSSYLTGRDLIYHARRGG